MMKFRNNKRRNLYLIAAVITVIIFATILLAIQNPFVTQKLTADAEFDPTQDFIKFIDVGQADSAIIYSNGYCAVIDVGLPNSAAQLSKSLNEYGIEQLDAVIISHLHSDHVGCLPQIAENFEIENLIMPEVLGDSINASKRGKDIAIKNGCAFYEADQGINFKIGEFELTVLSDFEDETNENNRSLFVMAQINDLRFLFTGDAEAEMEKLLLQENLDIDCDILKVGHHGSDTSCSKAFLDATTPDYAVISVGEDNMYSHPHTATLRALKAVDAEILRTDKSGDITFHVDGKKLKIEKEK